MLKNIQTFPSKEGNSPKLAETKEILLQVKKKQSHLQQTRFHPGLVTSPSGHSQL